MKKDKLNNDKVSKRQTFSKSVTDLRAIFEKKDQVTSPQLVRYKRLDSTNKSSEEVHIDSIYTTHKHTKVRYSASCPTSPDLQQATKMPAGGIMNSLTKAAGDLVGVGGGSSPTVTLTITDTPKPQRLKLRQSSLNFPQKSNNKGTSSATTTNPNSHLTASTADTPLSDHGDWAEDSPSDEPFQVMACVDGETGSISIQPALEMDMGQLKDKKSTPTQAPMEGIVALGTTAGVKRAPPVTPEKKKNNKQKKDTEKVKRAKNKADNDSQTSGGESMDETLTSTPNSYATAAKKAISSAENRGTMEGQSLAAMQNRDNGDPTTPMARIVEELQTRIDSLTLTVQQQQEQLQQQGNTFSGRIGEIETLLPMVKEAYQQLETKIEEQNSAQKTQESKLLEAQGKIIGNAVSIERIKAEVNEVKRETGELKQSISEITEFFRKKTSNGLQQDTGSNSDQGASIFMGGVQKLRDWNNDYESDPVTLVADLFRYLNIYQYITRMSLADNNSKTKGDRMGARAVIIGLISHQHKKDAIIALKRYLADNARDGLWGIDVGDCFSSDLIQRARVLTKYATAKKRRGKIIRFRVINKNGDAVLQTAQRGNPYRDDTPTEEELCRFMEKEGEGDGEEEQMDTREENEERGARRKTASNKRETTGANSIPLGGRQGRNEMQNRQGEQQAATVRKLHVPQPQGDQTHMRQRQNGTHKYPTAANRGGNPPPPPFAQMGNTYQQQQHGAHGVQYTGGPGEMTAGFQRANSLPQYVPGHPQRINRVDNDEGTHHYPNGGAAYMGPGPWDGVPAHHYNGRGTVNQFAGGNHPAYGQETPVAGDNPGPHQRGGQYMGLSAPPRNG